MSIDTDVLVVGGGGAAARAALEAVQEGVRVTLVMKGRFGESGATAYKVAETAGLQASTRDDDPADVPEGHYQDIMAAAQGMSDPRLSRILAEEAPKMIRDLEAFGVRFLRDAEGKYIRSRPCFSSRTLPPRGYNLKDHAHPIMEALRKELAKTKVQIVEDTMVTNLLVKDGSCRGAIALDGQGNFLVFNARAVVLGTGGAGQLFALNLNPADVTGDGYALAYRAGAELANMEFMQAGAGMVFPIRTLLHVWIWPPHPHLKNCQGEEFMIHYVPKGSTVEECMDIRGTHYPFTSSFPSKFIDIGIKKEILQGKGTSHHGIWADLSHLSENQLVSMLVKSGRDKAAERWAITKEWYLSRGVDLLARPFEITLYGHAINGGVVINEQAESNIAGLFACGETAAGPHGADRLGGNMLITCQVFGARAGRFAARRSKSGAGEIPFDMAKEEETRLPPLPRKGYFSLDQVRENLQWAMWNHVLVVRSEESLKSCLEKLDQIENEQLPHVILEHARDVSKYSELRNLVQIGRMITCAAQARKESRGSHYREDFPKRDDANWGKSLVIRENGKKVEMTLKQLGR